jgi:hypothetical protein
VNASPQTPAEVKGRVDEWVSNGSPFAECVVAWLPTMDEVGSADVLEQWSTDALDEFSQCAGRQARQLDTIVPTDWSRSIAGVLSKFEADVEDVLLGRQFA